MSSQRPQDPRSLSERRLRPEPGNGGTRLRLPVRLGNVLLRPWAGRVAPLDPDGLLEVVAKRTGLEDFGDRSFEEPLRHLLDQPCASGDYHFLGRYRIHHEVRRLLRTRLRLQDLIKRHPEIENQTIESPIFLIGLPGSGSGHLYRLLCRHPSLRSLPPWEAHEPLPRTTAAEPDLDIRERERRLLQNNRRRQLALAGAAGASTDGSQFWGDEQQLMGLEFASLDLEFKYESAGYRRWRMTTPQKPAYLRLKQMLQTLQWLRGGERWILHSSQHIDQLEVLLRVFPDAKVLHMHRDPQIIGPAIAQQAEFYAQLSRRTTNLSHSRQLWLDRTEALLRSCIRTRMSFPDLPVTDIRWDDYIANPIDTAERCFEEAAEPTPATLHQEMKDFHGTSDHGKHQGMLPPVANFEHMRERVEERLAFYREFFALAPESPGWPEST